MNDEQTGSQLALTDITASDERLLRRKIPAVRGHNAVRHFQNSCRRNPVSFHLRVRRDHGVAPPVPRLERDGERRGPKSPSRWRGTGAACLFEALKRRKWRIGRGKTRRRIISHPDSVPYTK